LFSPKFINPLYNDINKSKFGDSSNYFNFIVNSNIIKQNFINNNIGNLNYHLNGGQFNMYSAQKYSFENIMEDINKINNINNKNIKGSFNEKINKKDSLDAYKSEKALSNKTKNKIFKVTKLKEKKSIKKIVNKKMIQIENNNELKVLKNKKLVYINSFLLNSDSASKNIQRLKKVIFIGINRRGSKFRGVSKNGNQYQVLLMINK
jgi:ribosomal protein L16 Arg81 hydroxylase